MRVWPILLVVVAIFACEERPAEDGGSSTPDAPAAAESAGPVEGKFSLTELKVRPTADAMKADGAPDPETVRSEFEAALYASDSFDRGGTREMEGSLMFDVRPLEDGWDIMLFGGVGAPDAKFEASASYRTTDPRHAGKSIEELVSMGIASIADQISAQATIVVAGADELAAILSDDDATDTRYLMAIQEIRERRLEDAIPDVRPFLAPERSSKLRTAAAATLVQLGDEESRSDIIKVAEDLSRDKDPQYVPMLHILADLGGPEVVTYLQTVADAHGAPAVRQVAAEALRELRSAE